MNQFLQSFDQNMQFSRISLSGNEEINISFELKKKIKEERRRRNQAYRTLDYYLSSVHFFDFFSYDTFQIAKKSKFIAQTCQNYTIQSEFLLLPYFDSSLSYSNLLNRFNISKTNVSNEISFMHPIVPQSFAEIIKKKSINFFKNLSNKITRPMFSENYINLDLQYSKEIHYIFEKASENALIRFKTPIVSSEILLITMIEEKETRVGKLIQKFVPDQSDLYYLRFFLLKKLHSKELAIRNNIKKNLRYFVYLFAKEISESEVEKHIKSKRLEEIVEAFRDEIISRALKQKFFYDLISEVQNSLNFGSVRKYSI